MARLLPKGPLSWRFGLVVLLLTAISLGIGYRTSENTNENTRCLATYAQRQAEVSAIRSAATAERDAALNALNDPLVSVILQVTRPDARPVSPVKLGELRAAAKRYKIEQADLAARRAANPLPDFPSQCREINK